MLTDFQNFFTDGLGICNKHCLNIPPRLQLVSALSCEIRMLEKMYCD